ncbi:sensor histidine kinase [Shouchella shacheensis]|uniref:sensor histidine kinase n=1 Tax=Shouchella shacheensis TaxID=1649580 RepID=UPI00073FEA96|nr:histidine kinase [Shouchella shacheensis]
MIKRLTLFQKVIVLMVGLLVPVVGLYTYSNYVSEQVIREEIHTQNMSKLDVAMNRIEADLEQVSQFLVALSVDSDVSKLRNLDLLSHYEAVVLQNAVLEKMLTYQQLSNMLVDVSIYLPGKESAITTMSAHPGPLGEEAEAWFYVHEKGTNERNYFIRHLRYPLHGFEIGNEVVIEARVYEESVRLHLAELGSNGAGQSVFYHPDSETIEAAGATEEWIFSNMEDLNPNFQERQGTFSLRQGHEDYLISFIQSPSLGWVLVDYIPMEEVLSPVQSTRVLFYGSVCLLLLFGLVAAGLLYKHVHVPVYKLKEAIHRFKGGDYSVRMDLKKESEFQTAMSGFNEMAERIQTLIEKVYEEKIHSQDASLKLLQAQINPHFLYNCLFYMKNMAKVKNTEAVEAMALQLGRYYRFRTKVEDEETYVGEELELIQSFLEIHALRKSSLSYDVSVPEPMKQELIPRLLIQPIVENAMLHGIEHMEEPGLILVKGEIREGYMRVAIDDNGPGLSEENRSFLQQQIEEGEQTSERYGMRNVHQRLRNRYGGRAGLLLKKSELGGLRVEILWEERAEGREG